MPPKLPLPHNGEHFFLFQNCPRDEGNCAATERQKLSRGNFCPAASICLSGPSGHGGCTCRFVVHPSGDSLMTAAFGLVTVGLGRCTAVNQRRKNHPQTSAHMQLTNHPTGFLNNLCVVPDSHRRKAETNSREFFEKDRVNAVFLWYFWIWGGGLGL